MVGPFIRALRPWAAVLIAGCCCAHAVCGQSSQAKEGATQAPQHLRSRLFVYDLRDGSSKLVYTDDSIWEAPNWSPDGQYLISNHNDAIYKLVFEKGRPRATRAKQVRGVVISNAELGLPEWLAEVRHEVQALANTLDGASHALGEFL